MAIKILECRAFSSLHSRSGERIVKDYEIDLELGESRILFLDNKSYPIQRGNVTFHKPGQRISCQGTQNSILLTLDFSDTPAQILYSRNIPGPQQPVNDYHLLKNLGSVIVPFSESAFLPIYNELLTSAFTDQTAAEYLVMELLYKLNAEQCRTEYTKRKPTETACSRVLHYLKDNLEQSITLETLADMVHLDKSYLVRRFRNTYGVTPIKMLIQLRMERACDLITTTDLPISQIASACGYSSAAYFTSEYRRYMGCTPAAHRNKRRS